MNFVKNKMVIIGAGMVGSAVLNSALSLGLLSEIAVVNRDTNKARGEAMDASHTTSFAYSPNVNVHEGNYEDCREAQIIVITAGPSIKPGETEDRMLLMDKNVRVIKDIMKNISKYTKDAIIIIVTNPLDVMTYIAQKDFDYPRCRIIGTGTLLDTARLRRVIALRYGVDTKNVHGYILGEHGSTAFAAWSLVNVAGIPLERLDSFFHKNMPFVKEEILNEVKKAGWEIVRLKGFTNSGVAMSVCRIVKAVLLNEMSILPVSTILEGEYGIKNVALSLPCIISNNGIERKLEIPLSEDELEGMKKSADSVSRSLKEIGY